MQGRGSEGEPLEIAEVVRQIEPAQSGRGKAAGSLGGTGIGRADLYDAFLLKAEETPRILDFFDWLSLELGLDPPSGRALEIGCGTGRLLDGFARRWGRITGIDPDLDYLARAEDRARSNRSIEVRPGGFTDIEFEDEFDLIVSVNGPFFYLLTPRERREALLRVHRALKPGGVAFFDLANFLYLLRTYREGTLPVVRRPIGRHWVTRRSEHFFDFHDAIWGHRDTFEVEQHGGALVATHIETFRFAIITPPEILDGLLSLGFVDLRAFNGWDSRASEVLAGPRIMLAARKGAGGCARLAGGNADQRTAR